jgi:heptosyltransferase III
MQHVFPKILVLRGGALGDLLLTLPVIDAIRAGFPESFIELWGIHPQAGLVQSVDRIARLDAPNVAPVFIPDPIGAALQGRLRGFDLAVSFLSDPGAIVAENLISAGVRGVVTCSPLMRAGTHAVYQLASVLEPLGAKLLDPMPRLKTEPIQDQKLVLGFHPGSGSPAKNWPVECWGEFVETVAQRFDKVVLFGGEADLEITRIFQPRYCKPGIEAMICPNLWDLARALSRCTVFVGHDTGVTHLAAAVKTPVIALFGPTDPVIWRPMGERIEIVRAEEGRMGAISVETVVEAMNRVVFACGPKRLSCFRNEEKLDSMRFAKSLAGCSTWAVRSDTFSVLVDTPLACLTRDHKFVCR